jgi:ribosomal protein S18 acetylase RimI-like enzyme
MGDHTSKVQVYRAGQVHVRLLHDLLAWRRMGSHRAPSLEPPARLEETLHRMRTHLRSPSLWVWLAQLQGEDRLAGYVSVAKILKPDGRVTFYVDELWVPPLYRRQGIATRLMQEVLAAAKALALSSVRLAAPDSGAAQAFYQSLGFDVRPSRWAEITLRAP